MRVQHRAQPARLHLRQPARLPAHSRLAARHPSQQLQRQLSLRRNRGSASAARAPSPRPHPWTRPSRPASTHRRRRVDHRLDHEPRASLRKKKPPRRNRCPPASQPPQLTEGAAAAKGGRGRHLAANLHKHRARHATHSPSTLCLLPTRSQTQLRTRLSPPSRRCARRASPPSSTSPRPAATDGPTP